MARNSTTGSFAERVSALLKADTRVSQWRLNAVRSESVRIGIDSNQLGGPYSAPRGVEQLAGEVYIVWDDGRRSLARVDPGNLENPRLLNDWHTASYNDPDHVDVLAPLPLPEIQLAAPDARVAVEEAGKTLFAPIGRFMGLKGKARFISASVSGGMAETIIRSSRGHDVCYTETVCSASLSLDSLYDDSVSGRRLPDAKAIERMIGRVTERHAQLNNDAKGWLSSGPLEVVFEPEVVQELVSHYLLGNLLGSNVANGQSAFRAEGFGSQKVMRDDISLRLDPTRPLHPGSYLCTREGVPAAAITLIDRGVLITPTLDVKYANRLKRQPTPLANGSDSLVLVAPEDDEKTLLFKDMGLLVCSVLGMHTQDATSGNFSLTAGQALELSDNGAVGGRVKAVVSGNVFDVFTDPNTRFARVEGKDFPMMRARCRVTFD